MASFEKRGNSVRAIVSLGRGKRISQTFDTMTEARAWAAEQERDKHLGKSKTAYGKTVGDLFVAYLPVAETTDSGRSNSIRLMKWLDDPLCKIPLDSVITHDINEWILRRSKSRNERTGSPITPATVNRELNLISGAFTWAKDTRRWIAVNPCHGAMRPPKSRPRKRDMLTPDEIQAICLSSGYRRDEPPITLTARIGACFLLALETGMRSGEILRLQPRDYIDGEAVLHVRAVERGGRKGARSGRNHSDPSRNVPLTQEAIRIIKQLIRSMPDDQKPQEGFSDPPYVVGMDDRQRDALWRKVRNRAGVENLTFHDTKHEAATRLSRFIDVLALSHAMGTKDIRLLRDTYYNDDAKRTAALLPKSLTEVK